MSTSRRAAAAVAFAAILVGGFQHYYLRLLVIDKAPLRVIYTELPYRKIPGFRAFLTSVRPLVPEGAPVALWSPELLLNGGYTYAYYRASYLLGGRRVIPMAFDSEPTAPRPTLRLQNIAEAQYVVTWGRVPAVERFELVHQFAHGGLWRRQR